MNKRVYYPAPQKKAKKALLADLLILFGGFAAAYATLYAFAVAIG